MGGEQHARQAEQSRKFRQSKGLSTRRTCKREIIWRGGVSEKCLGEREADSERRTRRSLGCGEDKRTGLGLRAAGRESR